MFNFSFCLIARNEEKTLPRLLTSIKHFIDNGGEVVIVDTGSKDNTAQVARDMGCIVHEVGDKFRITISDEKAKEINDKFVVDGEEPIISGGDSLFDFASARNYAASLCSNNMISMPDADELYAAFDYVRVCEMIQGGIEQFEYNFVFSHDHEGNPAIQFMHSKFYDRRKLEWKGIIHEILQGNAVRKYVGDDVIKLEHFQNVETNRSGYLKGLALDCFEHPYSDRNSHYLGRELLWTGRSFSAIRELTRHVSMNQWPAERAQSLVYMGEAYEQIGFPDLALQSYFKAHLTEGEMREPLIKIAEYFFKREDWRRTIVFCEGMLSIKQGNFYASLSENYKDKPYHMLYVAYWHLGDKEKSKEYFDKALELSPLNSKYLHDYRFYYNLPTISILVPTLGRPDGLERLKRSIDSLNYPKELLEVIIEEDEPRIGVPKRLKELYNKSTGTYIVYAANDTEFYPDTLILAILDMMFIHLLAFDTGKVYEDEGNICEHFMISRHFVENELFGEIFDTEFHHCGVDNLLWAKAKRLGCAKKSTKAKMIHNHFSKTGETDDVYNLAYSHAEEDRELLKKKLGKLEI